MQETDGFDCAGQGCLDAACDPAERAIRQVEALLLGWCGQIQQFAHPCNPAELVRPVKAYEISGSQRARRLRIGQPVNHRTMGVGPGRFSPAKQWHKVVANQAPKLDGSPLFISDDPAIIEEDVQWWHDSPPHIS